jgi:hypothetical protein
LKKKIGFGRFGAVFSVDNPYIKKEMAMKIMNLGGEKAALKSLDGKLRVGSRVAFESPYTKEII